MLTGSWKNFTDSERMKAPKTGCLLKFKKAKTSISLDSRFIDLENAGFSATLKVKIAKPVVLEVRCVFWPVDWE